ncbi:hypothetical protein JCM16303_006879 [Sporobolomyces ruberrimus]
MSPPGAATHSNDLARRDHVRSQSRVSRSFPSSIVLTDSVTLARTPPVDLTSDVSPVSSRGTSPTRSLASKLFRVTPPESNTFELRTSSLSLSNRRNAPISTSRAPSTSRSPRTDTVGAKASTSSFFRQTASFAKSIGKKVTSSLWVHDGANSPQSRTTTPRPPHLHGDDDLPSTPQLSSNPPRPPALSRFGQLLVLFLFVLGLREILGSEQYASEEESRGRPIQIIGRNPFSVLRDFRARTAPLYSTSIPALESTWKVSSQYSMADYATHDGGGQGGDVTAILLHWKRTDNMRVIIASLCQYSFISSIVVWNNNPNITLSQETFSTARCPSPKLQIHNSPQNLLFSARYFACMQATTPYCYFQDDDWLVQPMRSLYAQFKRGPEESILVGTTKEMAVKYRSDWCFFQGPLHTCFAWLGTGAFVARRHVASYLEAVSSIDFPRDELAHADNSFTTFLNRPPYVMSSNGIVEMKTGTGYSDGVKGDLRNHDYIQKGLHHFVEYLNVSLSKLPPTTPLPTVPIPIDTSSYRSTPPLPLALHPYAHHARSPCLPSDLCFFITNIPLLLPPDSTPYPGPHRSTTLGDWEKHVGMIGKAEEEWSLAWGYENAVDGKPSTAFRSVDVARKGDFIGLGLIRPLDPIWTPSVEVHVMLEDAETFALQSEVQVSSDGYEWTRALSPTASDKPTFSCATTNQRSTRPDVSFPDSTLSSPKARSIRQKDLSITSSKLGQWWEKRRTRRQRLEDCRVEISSVLRAGGRANVGWTFVRLVVDGPEQSGSSLGGWGVYEFWLKAKKVGV